MANPRGRPAEKASRTFSATRLARRLRSRGISGNELDMRCRDRHGVSCNVSKYLRREARPSVEALAAMATELGCAMEDLLERREDAA